jgi:hypothetical protein
MKYKCDVCGKVVSGDLKVYRDHSDRHIVDILKLEHPDWTEKDGMCPKCMEHYKGQIKGESKK